MKLFLLNGCQIFNFVYRNGGSLEGKPLDVQKSEKGSVESVYVNSQ